MGLNSELSGGGMYSGYAWGVSRGDPPVCRSAGEAAGCLGVLLNRMVPGIAGKMLMTANFVGLGKNRWMFVMSLWMIPDLQMHFYRKYERNLSEYVCAATG